MAADDDLEVPAHRFVRLVDLRRPMRADVLSRAKLPRYAKSPTHLSLVELRLAEEHLGVLPDAYDGPPLGLIIGENPGRRTHADLPLFPDPPTSSGGRLLVMSGLTAAQYLGRLYRKNLCDALEWSKSDGRERARLIVTALFDMPRDLRVVMCGRKVARAFDQGDIPFWHPFKLDSRQRAVCIPHPSGLSHAYNDVMAKLQTRSWMRWAALGESEPR